MQNIIILGGNSRLAKKMEQFFSNDYNVIKVVNNPEKENEFTFRTLDCKRMNIDFIIDCIRIKNYTDTVKIKDTIELQKEFIIKNKDRIKKYFLLSTIHCRKIVKKLDEKKYNQNYIYHKLFLENFLIKTLSLSNIKIIRLQKIAFNNDTSITKGYVHILKKLKFILVNNLSELIYYKSIMLYINKLIEKKDTGSSKVYLEDNLSRITRYQLLKEINNKYFNNKYLILKCPKLIVYLFYFLSKLFFDTPISKYYDTCMSSTNVPKEKLYFDYFNNDLMEKIIQIE